MPSKSNIPFLLIIAGLALAIYSGSINYPFEFDDTIVLTENQDIQAPSGAVDVFFKQDMVPENKTGIGFYRPVLFSSYALNFMASGLSPAAFRLTDIILHIINSFLVFLIALELIPDEKGRAWAGLAAALYCVHPIQTESVIFITARSVVLLATFCMSALYCYIRYRKTGRAALLALSAALYLLAVLTKESAVPFLGVFLLADYWLYRENRAGSGSYPWRAAAPLVVIASVFTASRADHIMHAAPVKEELGYVVHLLTSISVLPRYVLLLILPWGLSVDHDVPAVTGAADGYFIAGAVLAAAWVASMVYFIRKRPLWSALLAWPLLVILPEIIVPLKDHMVEYRLYLPMAGLCILATSALQHAVDDRPLKNRVLLLMACLIAVFGVISFERTMVWASPLSLWSDAAAKSKTFARPFISLGREYAVLRDFGKARGLLEKAIDLDPKEKEAYVDLGNVYAETGEYPRAVMTYRKVISMYPDYTTAYADLATAYLDIKDYESAYQTYIEMSLRFSPEVLRDAAQHFENRGQHDYADKLMEEYEAISE